MRRNILLFISLCVVGCAMMYAQQMPGLLQKGKADTQDCKAWVDEQLSEMSLKEKIGQLFIHTVAPLQTQRNKNNIYAAIKEYKVGGLLFSSGQLSNQVLLTNYAQSLAEVPLFITFDGEWGLAMRLKGTPRFPRNRVLGCIQDNELLYEYGKEVARQCKEIGVQINFAPVADVDVNPRNPVINTRSFGGDPRNVAQKVVAYARGLEDGGVLSVCKHFPGHGDTEVDSHKALPVLNFDRARLDSIELFPFKEAVKAGPGGYVAAIKCAKEGLRTAIVENRRVGGTCLNRGCIPAKAMIHASSLYREMQEAEKFGVSAEGITFDYEKIVSYKEETTEKLCQGIEQLLKGNGVTILCGKGSLEQEHKVKVTGEESEEYYDAEHVILAAGSKPVTRLRRTILLYSDTFLSHTTHTLLIHELLVPSP